MLLARMSETQPIYNTRQYNLLPNQMELSPLCFKPPSTTPYAVSNPMRALLNVKFPVLMLLSAILTLQLQSVSYFILQIG